MDEFEVIKQLGEGGFSIVYLAWDHSLERQIALKEYMPSGVASRSHTSFISARSEHHRPTFDLGLKSFINEAKLLAQFDHPALVKVYRFWEANGTAYMAMPFYKGLTFKETVQAMSEPPGEKWLLDVLDPLTASLEVIHARHCFHRDIAPDNIIILDGGRRPVLLDFGAARRVIGNMTQSLTVILKPGYAPVEQYAEIPGLAQGAWTDVYALGATIHWAIAGKPPPLAVGRTVSDSYVPLVDVAHEKYSKSFLQAINRALKVLPEQRTPSMEAFRQELGIRSPSVATAVDGVDAVDPEATILRISARDDSTPYLIPRSLERLKMESLPMPARNARTIWIMGSLIALTIVGVGVFFSLQERDEKPITLESPTTQVPPEVKPVTRGPAPINSVNSVDAPPHSNTPSTSETLSTPSVPWSMSAPADKEPAAAASHASKKSAPEATVTTTRTSRKKTQTDAGKECARLMTQLSLGDQDPAISEKLRTLNCR